MFIVTISDIGLSLIGIFSARAVRSAENNSKKIFLVLSSILTILLIFFINYKFIGGKYWWVISIIFTFSIIQSYFMQPKSSTSDAGSSSYKGD